MQSDWFRRQLDKSELSVSVSIDHVNYRYSCRVSNHTNDYLYSGKLWNTFPISFENMVFLELKFCSLKKNLEWSPRKSMQCRIQNNYKWLLCIHRVSSNWFQLVTIWRILFGFVLYWKTVYMYSFKICYIKLMVLKYVMLLSWNLTIRPGYDPNLEEITIAFLSTYYNQNLQFNGCRLPWRKKS